MIQLKRLKEFKGKHTNLYIFPQTVSLHDVDTLVI